MSYFFYKFVDNHVFYLLLFQILYILIAMSYFYYNCANGEMNRFERITLRELKQLLRVWTRYFQTLERQGLVTESDRREIGKEIHKYSIPFMTYHRVCN
jgi:hypothetical protein